MAACCGGNASEIKIIINLKILIDNYYGAWFNQKMLIE